VGNTLGTNRRDGVARRRRRGSFRHGGSSDAVFRETGGDLDELTDTDRENTRRLYKLTFDVVQELAGSLQVIALDHAGFDEDWFAGSVIERWRGGDALIPASWRQA